MTDQKTSFARGAMGAAVLAVVMFGGGAAARQQASPLSSFKYQYKIGVLPFVDDTGSGGEDLAAALSRAVQAELAHATDLQGRVLRLEPGTDPSSVDADHAVTIGRAQNVDVVVLGTVLSASSDESDHTVSGPTFGGIHLGGSSHSVKAEVLLQGDLYDTTSGKQMDSLRVTGHASDTHVGADVSTSLGDLSTGGVAFDNSPIGKALHAAVADLVKKVAADESRMTRYQRTPQ
ncbi:MAG TPA: CsgG/HfaB family protein [Vicinamibacterales bacterium]|jgi:hypothetical protein